MGTSSWLTVVSVAGRPSCAAEACAANSVLFGAHLRAYPLGLVSPIGRGSRQVYNGWLGTTPTHDHPLARSAALT